MPLGQLRPAVTPTTSYWPLLQYLQNLPSTQDDVTLPLSAIELLVEGPLPRSVLLPNFWAASVIAAATWNRSGFAATLDRDAGQVSFRRYGSPGSARGSAAVAATATYTVGIRGCS